jgi:hypothetical protein
MDILINELSLKGQFSSVKQFVDVALIPFIEVINELDRTDTILKKQDFWDVQITEKEKLYSLVCITNIGEFELRLFQSLLRNLSEPYWETSRKHNVNDIYEYKENDISGSSLAEACERDKTVISFIHADFSSVKLQKKKKKNSISIDNLFSKEHYIEVANDRNEISKCEYFERKFALGLITLLENEYRFVKMNRPSKQNTPVYKENETGRYWHLDNFHTQHEEDKHYEVYDSNGKHIGIANTKGIIDYSGKVNGRTL